MNEGNNLQGVPFKNTSVCFKIKKENSISKDMVILLERFLL